MTPTRARRARARARRELDGADVEVEGRERDRRRAAWAPSPRSRRARDEEPALITLRYEGRRRDAARVLGLVGKAVTFDTGGISIKPAAKMYEMKFDMSRRRGGARGDRRDRRGSGCRSASSRVVGATENMPQRPRHPARRHRARDATARRSRSSTPTPRAGSCSPTASPTRSTLGAERLVDLATLTGAIVTALGSRYAGLFGNDDDWAPRSRPPADAQRRARLAAAAARRYDELIKSRYADIANAVEARKAGSIAAAQFLRRFTGDVAVGAPRHRRHRLRHRQAVRAQGRRGFGVRTLIELARAA